MGLDSDSSAATGTGQVESLLRQIQAQLNGSKGTNLLAAAYVKAWAEMPNVQKNSNNPHLGNDYADLSAVLETVKPVFAKYDLALFQAPGELSGDGLAVKMPYVLFHSSGQSLTGVSELPCSGPAKKDGTAPKPTAQTVGSAITYGRRYQAQCIAGIASVDDDGNAASNVTAPRGAKEEPEPAVTVEDLQTFVTEMEAIEPGATYLDDKDQPMTAVAKLEAMKPRLQKLNDEGTVKQYLTKRKALKAAASAAAK